MTHLKATFAAVILIGTALGSAAQAGAPAADLTISFTGIEEQQGAVLGAVFDSEAAYNGGGKPVRTIMVAASKAEVAAQLNGRAPGTYAIKAFHDVDGDQQMGTNPFGMPIEPFAFSNNAQGQMGPAKWADAKFDVTPGTNSQSIIIR